MGTTTFSAINKVCMTVYRKNKIEIPDSKDITQLMDYFHVDKEEAVLFAYFTYRKIEESCSYFTLEDINRDVDVSMTETLSYIPTIENLLKRGLFCLRDKIKFDPKFQKVDRWTAFTVDEELIDLITYNKPIEDYKPTYSDKIYNAVDFVSSLYNLPKRMLRSKYSMSHYVAPYMKDPWVKKLVSDLVDMGPKGRGSECEDVDCNDVIVVDPCGDWKIFLYFCMLARQLWTEKTASIKGVLSDYDVSTNDIIYELNEIKTEKSVLIKREYFELDKTDIADNIEVVWGPRVLEAFKGYEDLLLQESNGKELQKIEFKDIKSKNLYYNESNEKDIERLESIMKEENYLELRKRLDEKGLPKGLTVLLYGAPGTGKTETVMQLARKTGRDVYHLNIEQIKSCWVGESEKNIKAIFKSYYASKAKIKPILLFNEADAIISKRTSVDGSNAAVTKMENAIQNLLLEELEKFDGIFIATTNRATDIDSAFDRRLLFKLKFENPNTSVKVKIWKDRLNWLDDNDATKLAERYDLSGGQIDNIYRKSEIDYLLYGKMPSVDELLDFCKKEKLGNEGSSRIGFCN